MAVKKSRKAITRCGRCNKRIRKFYKHCDGCQKEIDIKITQKTKIHKDFAIKYGLSHFIRPDKSRYLEPVDPCAPSPKKTEYPDFVDLVWDIAIKLDQELKPND